MSSYWGSLLTGGLASGTVAELTELDEEAAGLVEEVEELLTGELDELAKSPSAEIE